MPRALAKTDNMDLLDAIGAALAKRAGPTELYKVRAHNIYRG